MWKDFSSQYLKHNRASCAAIMAGAFLASLFLSLLSSLFYQVWMDNIDRIRREEGSWQARIQISRELASQSESSDPVLSLLEGFGNVETVVPNSRLSRDGQVVYDLTFQNPRTIYQDVPLLLSRLGLEPEAASYHSLLLSRYLIHDPQDATPPLLLPFLLLLLLGAALALVLIIHNTFAVSMQARIRQFGILSSIGATPAQIRICLMQEAAALCLLPILTGTACGIALSFAVSQAANALLADMEGHVDVLFRLPPLLPAGILLLAVLTVLLSAWIPARRMSRMTPLEAIRNMGDLPPVHRNRPSLLSLLFGIEGELAGSSLKLRKKALRTTMLSLTLSFLAFTIFSCFTAFSRLSVYETSFSKYQDYWDIYMTVKDTDIEGFQALEAIRALENVENAALYQRAEAHAALSPSLFSSQLNALGGLSGLAGSRACSQGSLAADDTPSSAASDPVHGPTDPQSSSSGGLCLVKAPLLILDDASFLEYCRLAGVEPRTDGAILLNRIWDSLHSNFRSRSYVPFLREEAQTALLTDQAGNPAARLPILGYTCKEPVLWEEYEDYSLVHILPLSLWNTFSKQIPDTEPDTQLRIFSFDDTRLNEDMDAVQSLMDPTLSIEIHNRIQDFKDDENMWRGLTLFADTVCVLLALIGIANIFSHTYGFLRLRRREFAQYLSVGITPQGIRRILWIEALSIAGKPALITLPLTFLVMLLMIRASYMPIGKSLAVMPLGSIFAFLAAIFLSVGLAYFLGGRRLLQGSLLEALRNETAG